MNADNEVWSNFRVDDGTFHLSPRPSLQLGAAGHSDLMCKRSHLQRTEAPAAFCFTSLCGRKANVSGVNVCDRICISGTERKQPLPHLKEKKKPTGVTQKLRENDVRGFEGNATAGLSSSVCVCVWAVIVHSAMIN